MLILFLEQISIISTRMDDADHMNAMRTRARHLTADLRVLRQNFALGLEYPPQPDKNNNIGTTTTTSDTLHKDQTVNRSVFSPLLPRANYPEPFFDPSWRQAKIRTKAKLHQFFSRTAGACRGANFIVDVDVFATAGHP